MISSNSTMPGCDNDSGFDMELPMLGALFVFGVALTAASAITLKPSVAMRLYNCLPEPVGNYFLRRSIECDAAKEAVKQARVLYDEGHRNLNTSVERVE